MKTSIFKKQLRDFGLLFGFGFVVFLGIIIPAMNGHGFKAWTLWVGLPALILALFIPGSLYYPYKWWIVFGNALGLVNNFITLGFVFFVVLLPIGFFMQLFGYDPLRKRRGSSCTYREIRQQYNHDLTRIF